MTSKGQLVKEGSRRIAQAGLPDARLEAELLLGEACQLPRSQLLARLAEPIDIAEAGRFEGLLRRRLTREPLAYILGRREFFGREFIVNSDVLIPRPETELLVHRALELLDSTRDPLVIDVGTGSGAIGLSILAENPRVRLLATDISRPALRVAQVNARRLAVEDRVDFLVCDLFSGIRRAVGWDLLILANLPYVPSDRAASLQAEVRDFEPRIALFSPGDGLQIVRRALAGIQTLTKGGEYALLEIDDDQGLAVREVARNVLPAFEVSLARDSAGLERMLELRNCIST